MSFLLLGSLSSPQDFILPLTVCMEVRTFLFKGKQSLVQEVEKFKLKICCESQIVPSTVAEVSDLQSGNLSFIGNSMYQVVQVFQGRYKFVHALHNTAFYKRPGESFN